MNTERVGGYSEVKLPDDFAESTSWQRACNEETRVDSVNRAEWMVRVGDGDRHRFVFGTRSGTPVGECDCKSYTHHEWCAHLAAVFLAYVREEIVVADLDADRDEELAMLWRKYRRGGESRTGGSAPRRSRARRRRRRRGDHPPRISTDADGRLDDLLPRNE